MTERTAYLTLPGLSVTTILINIPCILALEDPSPIILMDEFDYNRLWEETLKDADENRKAPFLLMAYDDLRRRGLIHLIDYAKYYPQEMQQHYLSQNQALLESTPDWVNQKAAVQAATGWIEYGRGSYQEPFRESLGEEADGFRSLRREEERLRQKMKRGGGDPVGWNRKVLNKDIAALAIRRRADQVLDINVSHVITGDEHTITGGLLTAAGLRSVGPSSNILDIGFDTIDFDTSDYYHLDPENKIKNIDPSTITQTREVLSTVSKIATEMTGIQCNDKFILGPTLALPDYKNTSAFDFDIVKGEILHGLDARQLATETAQVIAMLEDGIDNGLPPNRLSYQSDAIAEQYNIPISQNKTQNEAIAGILDHATNTSNYSYEIKSILNRRDISQAAGFVALSIMSDPVQHYDKEDIYRRGMNFMAKFDPSLVIGLDVDEVRKGRRSSTWGERADWFESDDRRR